MQVPTFNNGKWVAVGDEEGFVSIINAAAPLPQAFLPGDPEAPRPQAQWLAHHNAIFDLAWCQVRAQDPLLVMKHTKSATAAVLLELTDIVLHASGCLSSVWHLLQQMWVYYQNLGTLLHLL